MTAPDLAVERLGADYFADPYSVHARLRARRPVTPVVLPGGMGTWLITGYAEARAALADPRLSKHMPGWHPEPDSIFAALDLHMLNSDPPDHERLLAAKRREPGDDLLSALIAARDEEDSLSENELVSMAFLLLVAGHETTVNLIASGVLALLLNPAELARLRAEPALIGGAVEELLRYVNPVNHTTFRCAAEPVEIGGVRISLGDPVLVALSGANRDPARFGDPDRLDLGRDSAGHLAFGHGIHYCLGAPLARLEAEIAVSALLARFGSISLAVPAESLRWRPSTLIHGLESLPVRLGP